MPVSDFHAGFYTCLEQAIRTGLDTGQFPNEAMCPNSLTGRCAPRPNSYRDRRVAGWTWFAAGHLVIVRGIDLNERTLSATAREAFGWPDGALRSDGHVERAGRSCLAFTTDAKSKKSVNRVGVVKQLSSLTMTLLRRIYDDGPRGAISGMRT